MSQSSSQAVMFYKEVAADKRLWTIKDSGGFPAPANADGVRSHPFWSSKQRVEKIISSVSAYKDFTAHQIGWDDFSSKWVPGMKKDGLCVGVNWNGSSATGYDIKPEIVRKHVEFYLNEACLEEGR